MFEGRKAWLVYTALAIVWVVIVVRAASNVKQPEDFVVTVSQSDVQAFARERLDEMQARSFAEKVELCTIIFEDNRGDLGTTRVRAGDEAACDLRYFDEPGMAPLASIHTHGAFDAKYDSELPSLLDIEGDIESELDGYVATPGGRLWRVDWKQQRAVLVCREGCLRQDRAYRSCPGDPVATTYTLSQLTVRDRQPVAQC